MPLRVGGHVLKAALGDALSHPDDALASVMEGQHAIQESPWKELSTPLRVRMALYTGEAHEGGAWIAGQKMTLEQAVEYALEDTTP